MKTDRESIKQVRNLLKELHELEEALDVLDNYDVKAYCYFITYHNNNAKVPKDVRIPMTKTILKESKHYILDRITKINEELKKM